MYKKGSGNDVGMASGCDFGCDLRAVFNDLPHSHDVAHKMACKGWRGITGEVNIFWTPGCFNYFYYRDRAAVFVAFAL